ERDEMAPAIGRVAPAFDQPLGLERVEQGDEHARRRVHDPGEIALREPAVVVEQPEHLELPGGEAVRGVSGAQAVRRDLAEDRELERWAVRVLLEGARGCARRWIGSGTHGRAAKLAR